MKFEEKRDLLQQQVDSIAQQISAVIAAIDTAVRQVEHGKRNNLPVALYDADCLILKKQVEELYLAHTDKKAELEALLLVVEEQREVVKVAKAAGLLKLYPAAVKAYSDAAVGFVEACKTIDDLCVQLQGSGTTPTVYGPCYLPAIPKLSTKPGLYLGEEAYLFAPRVQDCNRNLINRTYFSK